ncbi:MAG: DUF624 domain-containing protein [Alkalibacterium sp.]|nr:DUF624 domain-containing protein [Alkalibacterium sp.]
MPEKAMSILEKGVFFIYLNILWFIGISAGLVLGGFLPSSLTAQLILEDEEFYSRYQSFISLTRRFFTIYKKNLKNYWKLSVLYTCIFAVLIINMTMVFRIESLSFLIYITILFSLYVIIHFLYLLPILTTATGKLSEKVKLGLLAPLLHLKVTLLNMLLIFTLTVMTLFYPVGLFLIYPIGVLELSRRLNLFGLKEKKLIVLSD